MGGSLSAADIPLRSGRRDASGVDTIELDIWTTLVPPSGFTAATVWSGSAPPDARVFDKTAQFGVPLNVTLVNATTYLVRAARRVRLEERSVQSILCRAKGGLCPAEEW